MKHWDFTEIKAVAFASSLSRTLPASAGDLASGGIILQSAQRLLNEIKASLSCRGGQPFIQCSARCLSRRAGRRRLKRGLATRAVRALQRRANISTCTDQHMASEKLFGSISCSEG